MSSLRTRLLLLLFTLFLIYNRSFTTYAAEDCTSSKQRNISIVVDFTGERNAVNDPTIHITIRGYPPDGANHRTKGPIPDIEELDAKEKSSHKPAGENVTQGDIVPRGEWVASEAFTLHKRSTVADIVMVDDSTIHFSGDSKNWISRVEKYEFELFGGLRSNFYVGEDGNIFEGLGWDHWNSLANGGLGYRSLLVRFMRRKKSPPSDAVVRAYKELINVAICRSILSPRYKLIPLHVIWDYRAKSAEENYIGNWEHYTEDLNFIFNDEKKDEGLFSVVVREEWTKHGLPEGLFSIQQPISKIVVSNAGPRCFNYHGCVQAVKILSESYLKKEISERLNFVIGEDGGIYEAIGWDLSSRNIFSEKALLVLFAGEFDRYGPHRRATVAFHRLTKLGIWLEKVTPMYELFKIDKPYLQTGEKLISEFNKTFQTIVMLDLK